MVIGVKLGNTLVTADVALAALLDPPSESSELNVMNEPGPFGCSGRDFCVIEQVRAISRHKRWCRRYVGGGSGLGGEGLGGRDFLCSSYTRL